MAQAQGHLIIIYYTLIPPVSVTPSFKRLNTLSLHNITWEAVPHIGDPFSKKQLPAAAFCLLLQSLYGCHRVGLWFGPAMDIIGEAAESYTQDQRIKQLMDVHHVKDIKFQEDECRAAQMRSHG